MFNANGVRVQVGFAKVEMPGVLVGAEADEGIL